MANPYLEAYMRQNQPAQAPRGQFDFIKDAVGNAVGGVARTAQNINSGITSFVTNDIRKKLVDNTVEQQKKVVKDRDEGRLSWEDADKQITGMNNSLKVLTKKSNENTKDFQKIDRTKAAADAADAVITLGTLGTAGLVKTAGKTAGQGILKSIGKGVGQGATYGGAYGALQPLKDKGAEATLEDVIGSAATGGALGGAGGGVLGLGGGILGKFVNRGQSVGGRTAPTIQARNESLGIRVGDKGMTPDKAAKLSDFANNGAQKYGGIRAGKPINQANDAQGVFNNVVGKLDDELEKVNRPLIDTEAASIVKNITNKMASSKGVGSKMNTDAVKFASDIRSAQDIKGLEALRREADDLAYTATGAGKTIAAKQAQVIRDSIDEFVTKLSPEYKAVKGDYSLAKELLDTVSKASKNAKGLELPIRGPLGTSLSVGGNLGVGAKNAVTGFLGKVNKKDTLARDLTGMKGQGSPINGGGILGTIAQQQVGRGAADIGNAEAPVTQTEDFGLTDEPIIAPEVQEEASTPFSQANIQNLILQDLQGNQGKNIANLLKIYEMFGDKEKEKTPLTSSQATRAAAAQNALNDIPLLEDAISSGLLGPAKAIPGAGTAVGRRLLGTENIDAALFNIADNILRARSGAAAPEAEVKRFVDTFLPGPLDSEQAKKFKLERAVRELYGYVNPTAASQGADVQQLTEEAF